MYSLDANIQATMLDIDPQAAPQMNVYKHVDSLVEGAARYFLLV